MRHAMLVTALVLTGAAATAAQPALPGQPPVPPRPVPVAAARLAQLEEEFELAEAGRDVRRAHLKAAEVAAEVTKPRYELVKKATEQGQGSMADLIDAQLSFEVARATVEVRRAELKEAEVKLKFARKRLDDARAAGVRPGPVRPVPVPPPAPTPADPSR